MGELDIKWQILENETALASDKLISNVNMGSAAPTSRYILTKGTHELVVEERETPKPTGTQILLQIEATGVCATDLHLVRKSIPYLQPKVNICGHEGVGRIVQLGPDVDADEWKVGERVSHRWIYRWCGACEGCQSGNEQFCDRRDLSGKDVDGCWAGESTRYREVEVSLTTVQSIRWLTADTC